MRTYLSTHEPRQLAYPRAKQLVDSYAKRLQKNKASLEQFDLEEVMAYRYQKDSIRREARRQWAVGLMDALDQQRQRILVSFFDELESERAFGVPTQPVSQIAKQEIQPLISGEYTQRIAQDEAKLGREITKRAEKLNGVQQQ